MEHLWQKIHTEFLTEYLHFSFPFDNLLRYLAYATYIAVGKKVLSTTDVHRQYRKQTHTTSKIPASLLLWLTLAFYANLPLRLFLLGTYLFSIGKCQATARRAWQQDMCIQPTQSNARCPFPLCACVAWSTAQLENGLVSISSESQKTGKEIYMLYLMILLLLIASLA